MTVNIRERFEELKKVIQAITGEDYDEKSRDAHKVTMRRCVIYRLHLDGLTEQKIGELLGINHATVHFHIVQMNNTLHNNALNPYENRVFLTFNKLV